MNGSRDELRILIFSSSERLARLSLVAQGDGSSGLSFQVMEVSEYAQASGLISDDPNIEAIIIDLTTENALELLKHANRKRIWKHVYLSVQLYDLALLATASPTLESALPNLLRTLMPLGSR